MVKLLKEQPSPCGVGAPSGRFTSLMPVDAARRERERMCLWVSDRARGVERGGSEDYLVGSIAVQTFFRENSSPNIIFASSTRVPAPSFTFFGRDHSE